MKSGADWSKKLVRLLLLYPERLERCKIYLFVGVWRSWLARTHGVREVAGSSPVTPTRKTGKQTFRFDWQFFDCDRWTSPVTPTNLNIIQSNSQQKFRKLQIILIQPPTTQTKTSKTGKTKK